MTLFEFRDLMPAGSCYAAAMAEDAELAEDLVKDEAFVEAVRQAKRSPVSPGHRGYNHDLADIKDLLAKLLHATAQRDAKKAPASPRPVSAVDKAIRDKRRAGLRSMVARAVGKG